MAQCFEDFVKCDKMGRYDGTTTSSTGPGNIQRENVLSRLWARAGRRREIRTSANACFVGSIQDQSDILRNRSHQHCVAELHSLDCRTRARGWPPRVVARRLTWSWAAGAEEVYRPCEIKNAGRLPWRKLSLSNGREHYKCPDRKPVRLLNLWFIELLQVLRLAGPTRTTTHRSWRRRDILFTNFDRHLRLALAPN